MAVIIEGVSEKQMPDRYLVVQDYRLAGEELERFIAIESNRRIVLGRDPDANLILPDDPMCFVSRKHCEIYDVVHDESSSHVFVRDLGSHNGTWVDNVIVSKKSDSCPGFLLQDGDKIQILPHWSLTFRDKRGFKKYTLTDVQASEYNLFKEKYEITGRCLGEGAQGVVCLAKDVKKKKQLVCKIVNLVTFGGSIEAEEQRRRKLQEADVLRQLRHPNILPYVDALVSPYSLYTFTELATGGDLWSYIYQHKTIGEDAVKFIVYQIVGALKFLHSKGVIHRDLKPENVLLSYSTKTFCNRVLLSDFGAYAVPGRSRMLTHAGTVNYQAPEIHNASQPQTAAVDMWSLGVVTVIMLTHGRPFSIGNLDRMEQRDIDNFLRTLHPKASVACVQSARECLRVQPEKRMTAKQALQKPWLHKAESHLRPLKRLNLNRRDGRKSRQEHELHPMPCDIPDVLDCNMSAAALDHHKARLSERLDLMRGPDESRPNELTPAEAAVLFSGKGKPLQAVVEKKNDDGGTDSSTSEHNCGSPKDGSVTATTPEALSEDSLDDVYVFKLKSTSVSQRTDSQPRGAGKKVNHRLTPLTALDSFSEDVADQRQLVISDLVRNYA